MSTLGTGWTQAGFVEQASTPNTLPVSVLVSGTRIALSWAAVPGAVRYTVVCGIAPESMSPQVDDLQATNFTIQNLTSEQTYFVQVTAVLSARKSIASSIINSTALPAPVLAASPCSGHINLNWTAVAAASSYSVFQGTSPGGEGATPVQSGLTGTSTQINGVTNGTAYYFFVVAIGPLISAASNEATTTPIAIVAPTVTATPGTGETNLSWSGGSGGQSYSVFVGTASGEESLYQAGVTGTSLEVTGLNNGQTYYFYVANINACGQIANSSEISSTTVMPAPLGLAAKPCSGDVELTWDAVVGASGYNVYMGTTSGGESPTPVLADVAGTSATVPSLTNGTEYFFTVKAIGPNALSPASSEVNAVPAAVVAPTVTPTVGDGEVTLSFSSLAGYTYAAYMSETSGGEAPPAVGSVAGTGGNVQIMVSGLTDGTMYYFTVVATNQCEQTATSAEVSAIPVPIAQLSGLLLPSPCLTAPSGGSCQCSTTITDTVTLVAAPGSSFSVTLRIRAVYSTKSYTGGTNDGEFFQTGGTPVSDFFNYLKMTISSPAQTYYLNRAWGSYPAVGGPTGVYAIDYNETFTIDAGAVVTLSANSGNDDLQNANTNNVEVSNNDPSHPILVAQPFDGGFAQFDAIAIVATPP